MPKATSKLSSKPTVKEQTTSAVKRKEAAKPKVTVAQRVDKVKKAVRSRLDNVKKRLGIKSKKAKKATREQKKLARQQKIHGIIGIGLLFVVVSIAYSTYMTVLFVDGKMMVAALVPQVTFAAITLLIAFYKIYK